MHRKQHPYFCLGTANERNRLLACLLLVLITACGLVPARAAETGEKTVFSVRGLGGGGGMFNPSISPDNPDLLLLSCDMGGAYRSADGGKTWNMLHADQGLRNTHLAPPPVYLPGRIYWITDIKRLCYSDDAGLTWTSRPQGPWKKRVKAFTVLPGRPDTVLIGTEEGLWRSEGNTWQQVGSEEAGQLLRLGDTVFAVFAKRRLMHGTDGGRAWSEAGALPGNVVALTGGMGLTGKVLLASVEDFGLVRSLDGGKNWKLVKQPYEKEAALRMPSDQMNLMYALQVGSVKKQQILKSTDGGDTWKPVFDLYTSVKSRFGTYNVERSWVQVQLDWGYYFTDNGLTVSQSNPDFLLAVTQGELFASRDGGKTWQCAMNTPLPPLPDGSPRQSSIGLEVTSCWGYSFDPHDPEREYIAYTDIGFARSLDRGTSWTWSAKGSPWTNTFYDLAFDPETPGKIYAAVSQRHDIPHYLSLSKTYFGHRTFSGGVVASSDWGASWKVPYAWKTPESLPHQVCTTVALDPNSPRESRTLYAGIFGEGGDNDKAGVYKSADGGKTWAKTPGQPGIAPNLHIYRLRLHPKTGSLYCLITGLRAPAPNFFNPEGGGIWMSEDQGQTWKHLSVGSDLNRWATSFAFDPGNDGGIYVSAATPQGNISPGGIYKTVNNGRTWFHVLKDKEIRRIAGEPMYDHCMAVAVHPKNPRLILAGTTLHGLLYSLDGGRIWRRYEEFPFRNAQSISFNPRDPDKVYVTTFGAGVWVGPVPGKAGEEHTAPDTRRGTQ